MSIGAPELRRRVHQALKAPLLALGFKKRAGSIFTVDLSEEVLGWLGLHDASRTTGGRLVLIPKVAIRHQPIERLVAQFHREKFHPYIPPTVVTALGYLTRAQTYTLWSVGSELEIRATADDLITTLRQYGIPYMHENSSLTRLCALMESGQGFPDVVATRLPVARLLMGDRNGAAGELARTLAEMGGRQDPAAVRFRSFASALQSYIEQASKPSAL